jgi:hypothetical protein
MAFLETEMWDDWFFVELCIDILFFIDVLVNCFSAYMTEEGELVTNRRKIMFRYMRGWMVLDLIACFPFSLLESTDSESE